MTKLKRKHITDKDNQQNENTFITYPKTTSSPYLHGTDFVGVPIRCMLLVFVGVPWLLLPR